MPRPKVLGYVPDNDGWTFDGYIEGVENHSPSLRFKYRPLISEERAEFREMIENKKAKEQEREISKKLAQRIKSWDLTSKDGSVLPITFDTVRNLLWALNQRLQAIVIYGTQVSDKDPRWDEPDPDETHSLKTADAVDGLVGN